MIRESAELEAQWLRAAAAGDTAAFSALYDRLAGPLFSLVTRIVADTTEAEDVLQETFINIWQRAGQFDPSVGSAFSWCATLARHKAIDRVRATHRRTRVLTGPDMDGEDPEPAIAPAVETGLGADEAGSVHLCVRSLPREQQQAIELSFFSGLTHHEIAASLGQPLGTVKARIRRGVLRLRDCLEGRL